MSITMRALLIQGLAEHMKSLTMAQAGALAHELTVAVSAHVAKTPALPTANSEFHVSAFPKETWNELAVGIPWEAYSYAYGALAGHPIAMGTLPICSAPPHLDAVLTPQSNASGLWGGSLLVALGKLLEGVKHRLLMFSPYWRTDGVQALLSAAGRNTYHGISVSIFTQPQAWMKEDDAEGLHHFVKTMHDVGADVRILAPRSYEGLTSIMHAKLMIADDIRAYVGSANFTRSGLDHGFEAGVLVEGEVVTAFAAWAQAIETVCEAREIVY